MGRLPTPSAYMSRVAHFAFRKTFTITDTLSSLAGVLVPAALFLIKKPAMDDWLPGAAAWFVLIMVGGAALLRLVTAPYFVWREQEQKIADLEGEIAKPDQQIRATLDQTIAASRVEIMGYATRMFKLDFIRGRTLDQLRESFEHEGVMQHVYHLSYDDEFQTLWGELKEKAYSLVRYVPKPPQYFWDKNTIDYHQQNVDRHWRQGEEALRSQLGKLSRHLLLKA